MKRIVFHITQQPHGDWQCLERGDDDPLFLSNKKKTVVKLSARYLSNLYYAGPENCEVSRLREHHVPGQLSQLVIHLGRKQRNRIQTEHTYGADPRRHRG